MTNAPDITEQIRRGMEWTLSHKHELAEVYQDLGYSGGDWKRPAWNQAIRDARRHAFGILWVWNQDRLARDTEQFLRFYRELSGQGVRIWEETAGAFIDMSTLGGRVQHQSLAQAAEIFRLVTSEKVRAAYRRKRERGESWGRPRTELTAEQVARARELRTQGAGWRRVASELGGVVSYQTVRRLLDKSSETS